jgi:O-antigen ligase
MVKLSLQSSPIATVLGILTFIATAITFIMSSAGSSSTLIAGLTAVFLLALTGSLSPQWIIYFALAVSTLTGGPALPEIPGFNFGVHGLFTTAILISSVITLIVHWSRVRSSWWIGLVPFLVFLAWTFMRSIGSPSLSVAVTHCIILSTPIVLLPVVLLAVAEMKVERLENIFFLFTLVPVLILAAGFLFGFVYAVPFGFFTPFGSRSLDLFLLIALCFLLATARFHHSRNIRLAATGLSILMIGIVILGLSRIVAAIIFGIVIPLILFIPGFKKETSGLFGLLLFFAGGIVFVLILLYRSFHTLELNRMVYFFSSDRFTVWPVVIRESLQSPLFGHGTGAVQLLTQAISKYDHPHNDFLRIFYDQGCIGLTLFLAAWFHRIVHHLRTWWKNKNIGAGTIAYRMHLASLLAAIGIFTSFLTDNTLMYVFILMPAFILFALADAASSSRNAP